MTDGVQTGLWNFYRSDGGPYEVGVFDADGKKHGEWLHFPGGTEGITEWYGHGNLLKRDSFVI
jgi:hypothetical protein